MNEVQNENTKAANQAWRKNPRKWAPKSRQGCKTCKIRRVKCDLAQPSCMKCHSTGRTCDGYGEKPLAFEPGIDSSHHHSERFYREESWVNCHPCTTTGAYQPNQSHANLHGPILQNLGPFMILPATGSAQAEAMCFFEYISINHLNEYQPCDSWRKSLMFFSQTVPAARHAATALALVHRNYYVDRDSNNHVHQPQFSKDWPQDKTVLIHYNLAIQLLLRLESDDSTEKTAVTLLVCYLFICLEHLMGNDVQAVKHLHGGVELSRNIDKSILNNDSIYDDAQPSGPRMLICQVAKQIRRLDMQTVMFLVDWTPAYMQETFMSHHRPSPGSAFRSLDQAADHLQILIARVMRLCWTEKQSSPIGEEPPLPSSHKDIVLGELKIWSVDFENMLERGSSSSNETGSSETHDRLVSLLRLQHTIAGSLLAGYGHGREMEYDNFLPQFEQAVTLAGDVVANSTHELYLGSLNPTFTPEIRILPVLYIIGVKCRHPTVRREVLRILRRRPIREAVWDSFTAARVIERVIEIEEGGSGKGQIASMEQIPVWQRIEAIAWVQSPGKLDLTYTFCARQGTHRETLVT